MKKPGKPKKEEYEAPSFKKVFSRNRKKFVLPSALAGSCASCGSACSSGGCSCGCGGACACSSSW